jgi:predicted metalloprotease with PDZ domain
MIRTFWIAFAVLFLFPFTFANAPLDKSIYTVTIDPARNELRVAADVTLEGDDLRIAAIGANQFDRRWAEFIYRVSVKDSSGKEVRVTETKDGWRIETTTGTRVRITYSVRLDHENHEWASGIDGAAYVRSWGIFSVGRAFALLNGTSRKDIEIRFHLPDGWNVSGSWKKMGEGRFIAAGNDDLTESMFFAGKHREFSLDREGFELQFAIGGENTEAHAKEYADLAGKVLDYYIGLMGGLPNPPPGVNFEKVLVIVNPGKSSDGEVIGKHISMILDSSGDPMGALFSKLMFAHEFFHLWNGKSIIPESVGEEWFKEGVTNYYTVKALRVAGALPEDAMFGVLNGLFYQRYSNDEALGKRSIPDVSSGDDKHKHWGMIYGGGLFAGICGDVAIRKSSGNRRSLDDVIVGLFKDYAGTDKEYSRTELLDRLAAASDSNRGFFEKFVYGTEPVPVAQCLSDAGLDAKVENGQLMVKRKAYESAAEKEMIDGMFGTQ